MASADLKTGNDQFASSLKHRGDELARQLQDHAERLGDALELRASTLNMVALPLSDLLQTAAAAIVTEVRIEAGRSRVYMNLMIDGQAQSSMEIGVPDRPRPEVYRALVVLLPVAP